VAKKNFTQPRMNLTPQQALENLAKIAADYPLRVRDREAINASIALLDQLVKAAATPVPAAAPADPKAP
jgi:hypothetical protein